MSATQSAPTTTTGAPSEGATETPTEHGPASTPSKAILALLKERDKLEALYTEQRAACVAGHAAAKKADDKDERKRLTKEALSLGGKAANRSAEIAQIDVELAAEDPEMTFWNAWVKPTGYTSRQTPMSQQEVQEKIARAYRVFSNRAMPESVRNTADQQIAAQLRNAERRGYAVTDPRS